MLAHVNTPKPAEIIQLPTCYSLQVPDKDFTCVPTAAGEQIFIRLNDTMEMEVVSKLERRASSVSWAKWTNSIFQTAVVTVNGVKVGYIVKVGDTLTGEYFYVNTDDSKVARAAVEGKLALHES